MIIHQQIIFATSSNKTFISHTVITYGRSVRHTLIIGKRKHKPLKMYHLIETVIIKSFIPRLGYTVGEIRAIDSWTHKLHYGIMSIGMPA